MSSSLKLDANFATERFLGQNGLTKSDLDEIAPRAKAAHQAIFAARKSGKLQYLDLPTDKAASDAAKKLAEELAGYENFVVLGIGGSSLGAKALFTSLCHPFHNLVSASARKNRPRVFFPDNSDAGTFAGLLDSLDLSKTAIAAVTKSGGTAETWAQLLYLREKLKDSGKKQIVAITDPDKGALRSVSNSEGWRTLPVPPAVGGRFSVLTAVGLLPAAVAGIDVDELLAGAAEMVKRCDEPDVRKNPAAMFASMLYLFDKRGRRINVFMPYADALRETADWYVQLWAESLGKSPEIGPTPIRAVGATDQHSMLQLLMEGPGDKVTVFLAVDEPRRDLTIPKDTPREPDVSYLGGHSFHELLSAEQQATAAALAKNGRPSFTIHLPKLDARAMGGLLMMLEIATSFGGELYGVNPYDQPGV
ncbi:MAG: glucose-6-phosphate isomerase, partial [Myxococcaceae bacterium]